MYGKFVHQYFCMYIICYVIKKIIVNFRKKIMLFVPVIAFMFDDIVLNFPTLMPLGLIIIGAT